MPNVKGSALEARFRWVEATHGAAGMDRLMRALPQEDRAIHEGVILPSSWYPFVTFIRVNETIDRVFGAGDLALVPVVARWAAEANLTTLYRFFYQLGSVGFILGMAGRLWRMNYDAGALEVDSAPEHEATLRIVDWPEPHRVHCLSIAGWAARSAELSGAREVSFEETACRTRGDATCEIRLTWK